MSKLGNFVARVACVAGAVVVVVVFKAKGEISRTRAHTRELNNEGYPQGYFQGLPISHAPFMYLCACLPNRLVVRRQFHPVVWI